MDVVESKYHNFQVFCHNILPENKYVMMLQKVPLNLFLQEIKAKNDDKEVEVICNLIFLEAEIDKTKLGEAEIQKFARYVEYFRAVLKSLG